MSVKVNCLECGGSGVCARCGGSGGGDSAEAQCRRCRGTGDCPRCEGEGTVQSEPVPGAQPQESPEREEP